MCVVTAACGKAHAFLGQLPCAQGWWGRLCSPQPQHVPGMYCKASCWGMGAEACGALYCALVGLLHWPPCQTAVAGVAFANRISWRLTGHDSSVCEGMSGLCGGGHSQ